MNHLVKMLEIHQIMVKRREGNIITIVDPKTEEERTMEVIFAETAATATENLMFDLMRTIHATSVQCLIPQDGGCQWDHDWKIEDWLHALDWKIEPKINRKAGVRRLPRNHLSASESWQRKRKTWLHA